MSGFTLENLKELKKLSNLSLPECKNALIKSRNNVSKALNVLKRKDMNDIEKAFDLINELSDDLKALKKEKKIASVSKKTSIGFRDVNLLKDIKLDKDLISFYKLYGDGFTLKWMGYKTENNYTISGCISFGLMKHVVADGEGIYYSDDTENPDLKNFHGLDYFIPEATCGIYIDPANRKQRQQIYYYENEEEIFDLDIDFLGYIEMACLAKVFIYWPKVLLDIQYGKESAETKKFKSEMPKLFEDFDWDYFVEIYQSLRLSKKSK